MAARMRWGDAMDEEDEGPTSVTLPSPSVNGPDSNGVKTYIDYK
jgi:hypothetical protein